jgi:archaellum component FlaD/FlaE
VGADGDQREHEAVARDAPDRQDSEALVYEWQTYLVEQVGLEGCLEALQYYQALDWLGEEAAAELEDYLFGVDPVEGDEADELEAPDHMRSLAYVGRLAANQDEFEH